METQIQYRKNKSKGGFIGMNKYAAKHNKIEWKHPEKVIEIYKKVPKDVRVATIRHEECERYLMRNKNMGYHKAHKLSLKFEEKNKPFPKTDIKRKLNEMGVKIR